MTHQDIEAIAALDALGAATPDETRAGPSGIHRLQGYIVGIGPRSR